MMKHLKYSNLHRGVCLLAGCAASALALAQDSRLNRATELRADKLAQAPVVQQLQAGTVLKVLGLEGGWAWVQAAAGRTGWVRAGTLNLPAQSAAAATLSSGRSAENNLAFALGVRSLPARVNRHALIIGVSRYASADIPALPGARIDRESATQMAQAMQVPASHIRYLQDAEATGDNIRAALAELDAKVQTGDRVFIHYSGHGTRYKDPVAGGCVEALLAYDGGAKGTITNREMSDLLRPLTAKTDKLLVMYDACHSGGLVPAASPMRTRGFRNRNDEGALRPKFAEISDECGRPVNVKTRNLVVEVVEKGVLPNDVVHISAARDNEVSFDDELKGGLATQFMRDCMLRDATDLDGSGAISIDEIRVCAQEKIEKRMANDIQFNAHHLTLSGNTGFVPTWFSLAAVSVPAGPVATAPSAAPAASAPTVAETLPTAEPAVALPPVAPLSGAQALQQVHSQRDAKRAVEVVLAQPRLRIGQDALNFSVRSERAGYVYVALAGSDNRALYLVFPNALDADNRIDAGKPLNLPGANWRMRAAGPEGTNTLLVMVTDSPRDIRSLNAASAGPFLTSLNDAQGRAALGALITTGQGTASGVCGGDVARPAGIACSDAYGSALVSIEEVQ